MAAALRSCRAPEACPGASVFFFVSDPEWAIIPLLVGLGSLYDLSSAFSLFC